MHVDQSRISQIETGDITRAELPTVTAYINALSGSVKVWGTKHLPVPVVTPSRDRHLSFSNFLPGEGSFNRVVV